jgi:hypothetical protein
VRRTIFCSMILSATLALLSAGQRAGATGYWNMPSSFCQCMGCGWGAGHHAPLILGPISWDGVCAHNEIRLPYSPTPPYGCAAYGNCGGSFGEPTIMEPAPAPPPAPAVAPMSHRHRPLFLR